MTHSNRYQERHSDQHGEEETPYGQLERVEDEEDDSGGEIGDKDAEVVHLRDGGVAALEHCSDGTVSASSLKEKGAWGSSPLSTWMSPTASFLAHNAARMSFEYHSATVVTALVSMANETPYVMAK